MYSIKVIDFDIFYYLPDYAEVNTNRKLIATNREIKKSEFKRYDSRISICT